ncbi:uncharacterized protein LOC129614035 [Condylostylus longicornis]|uniref:uncharacterized protein LOC129614035 n=1 Tax=Condylostylus longicornis TaxID=2530218 RepID=UPI00244E0025|nr:uncharacterized protein LOC129614035 [Condylostylus longicornis]
MMSRSRLRRGCYLSLACSIGSISLACGSLLQLQSSSDRISIQRGLFITSLGFLYFISLTDFFNKYLIETPQGIMFRRKYRLMVSDAMDITNKIVSAIQATFSFLAGLIVCKSTCSKSFLYASHCVMEAYAWFGTAYFMYDIWSMYKVHKQKLTDKLKLMNLSSRTTIKSQITNKNSEMSSRKINNINYLNNQHNNGLYDKSTNDFNSKEFYEDFELSEDIIDSIPKRNQISDFLNYVFKNPLMIMHHIFIGTFGFLVIVYIRGGGVCIYSFIYMMEFSTPFVSLRGILSKLGMKNSKLYIFNGFAMLISFFICRVFMWPYVFHWYSTVVNKSMSEAIMELPRGCQISIAILFFPQLYWFYLMLKGALKVFFPTSLKIETKSKNNNLSPETPDNPFLPNENLISSHLRKTIKLEKNTTE